MNYYKQAYFKKVYRRWKNNEKLVLYLSLAFIICSSITFNASAKTSDKIQLKLSKIKPIR